MPNLGQVTTEFDVNTQKAQAGLQSLSAEATKQIGILEQLRANLKASKGDLEAATDPASLQRLTAQIKTTQEAINSYTGKSIKNMRTEHRALSFEMRGTTEALLGITFLLSSFSTDSASAGIRTLHQSLSQGIQSALGFTFALKSMGVVAAGPIGILIGLGTALVGFFTKSSEEAKKAVENITKLKDEIIELQHSAGRLADTDYIMIIAERMKAAEKEYSDYLKLPNRELEKEVQLEKDALTWRIKYNEEIKKTVTGVKKDIEADKKADKEIADANWKNQEEYMANLQKLQDEADQREKILSEIRASNAIAIIADEYEKRRAEINKTFDDEHQKIIENARGEEELNTNLALNDMARGRALANSEMKQADDVAKKKEEAAKKLAHEQAEDARNLYEAEMDFAGALENAFIQAGESGLSTLMRMLKMAIQIIQTVNMAQESGAGFGLTQELGIGSILLHGFGFKQGGYTGNLPAYQPAGIVHGGEFVFEKPIVDSYRSELATLRESLRSGRGYASGGFVGRWPAHRQIRR